MKPNSHYHTYRLYKLDLVQYDCNHYYSILYLYVCTRFNKDSNEIDAAYEQNTYYYTCRVPTLNNILIIYFVYCLRNGNNCRHIIHIQLKSRASYTLLGI